MITILWGYTRATQNSIFRHAVQNTLWDIYNIRAREVRDVCGLKTEQVQLIFCDLNTPSSYFGRRADYVFGFKKDVALTLLKNHTLNDQRVDLCELIYNIEKESQKNG